MGKSIHKNMLGNLQMIGWNGTSAMVMPVIEQMQSNGYAVMNGGTRITGQLINNTPSKSNELLLTVIDGNGITYAVRQLNKNQAKLFNGEPRIWSLDPPYGNRVTFYVVPPPPPPPLPGGGQLPPGG